MCCSAAAPRLVWVSLSSSPIFPIFGSVYHCTLALSSSRVFLVSCGVRPSVHHSVQRAGRHTSMPPVTRTSGGARAASAQKAGKGAPAASAAVSKAGEDVKDISSPVSEGVANISLGASSPVVEPAGPKQQASGKSNGTKGLPGTKSTANSKPSLEPVDVSNPPEPSPAVGGAPKKTPPSGTKPGGKPSNTTAKAGSKPSAGKVTPSADAEPVISTEDPVPAPSASPAPVPAKRPGSGAPKNGGKLASSRPASGAPGASSPVVH